MHTLANRPNKKCDYLLLRSEQVSSYNMFNAWIEFIGKLVGTALVLVVKTELASIVRNVEGAKCKVRRDGLAHLKNLCLHIYRLVYEE